MASSLTGCLRCNDGTTVKHKIFKCTAQAPLGDGKELWDSFPTGGDLSLVPAKPDVCETLLNSLTKNHKLEWCVRDVLEAMYQKVTQEKAAGKAVKKNQTALSSNQGLPDRTGGGDGKAGSSVQGATLGGGGRGGWGRGDRERGGRGRGNGARGGSNAASDAATHPEVNVTKSTVSWSCAPINALGNRLQPDKTMETVLQNCPVNDKNDDDWDQARHGKLGKNTRIATNYVVVHNMPAKLYVYGVKCWSAATATAKPVEISRRSEKRLILESLREKKHESIANHDWATDGETVWSAVPLHLAAFQPVSGQLIDSQDAETKDLQYSKASGRTATAGRVLFQYHWPLDFPLGTATTSLLNPPGGQPTNTLGASVHIAALNGLITKYATGGRNDLVAIGPNKFFLPNGFTPMLLPDPPSKHSPLNAHRGYFSSIRPGSKDVLLNVGTKSGAFLSPMVVSDFFQATKHKNYDDYGGAESMLLNRRVRVCYEREVHGSDFDPNLESSRIKTIVAFGTPPRVQEFMYGEEGKKEKLSVRDYFVRGLGAPEPNPKLNCVNVGIAPRYKLQKDDRTGREKMVLDEKTVDKELWIPADFLELEPNQPMSRMLSQDDMASMGKVAQHYPAQTQFLIANEGLEKLGLKDPSGVSVCAARLQTIGLTITPTLLEIPGRFLPEPLIAFNGTNVPSNKASWALIRTDYQTNTSTDLGFVKTPSNAQSHEVHVLDFRTEGSDRQDLGPAITKRLIAHGLDFTGARPAEYRWIDQPPQDWTDDDLLKYVQNLRAEWSGPELFLVVLDEKKTTPYARVKRVFDQHLGLHTVCLTAAKLANQRNGSPGPDDQLLSNLALKFNIKLGGQNHRVMTNHRQRAFQEIERDTIVLGADVSHASLKMSDCPSVAAVVGNIDADFAQFPGSMRLQPTGKEVIFELKDMVAERVKAYTLHTGTLPKRMIFYRDGVGEDQFDCAGTEEIDRVYAGFDQARVDLQHLLGPRTVTGLTLHNDKVDLTFIVVGKRHNTRFFPRRHNQTSTSKKGVVNGNVLPGLIVDRVITRPQGGNTQIFDFFLQSHQAIQGTARSAHYIVLQKSASLDVDKIQQLTFNFCFNFARATKGVSYVGPAYYADRLCERGTQYLRGYAENRRGRPDLPKTDWQKTAGKPGTEQYQALVAADIAGQLEWNPNPTDIADRKNPWHPNLDNVMFWL
ncbi:hypothetical protein LTR17_026257 [Elasticomyces elasticus]|nr:hypothetical protein LTR17_026257 [Elasticomyces elasticus]